jgi:hypothetical protein
VGKKPGRGQQVVMHLEPKRAGTTIGCVVMAALFSAVAASALFYPLDPQLRVSVKQALPSGVSLDEARTMFAAIAGFLALMCVIGAIINGRRWHIARWVVRMSNDPSLGSLPVPEWVAPQVRATTIPPLEVRIVKARKCPKLRARCRRVKLDRNVVGHRPLQIAYLRLFENQPRIRTFIEGAWREFGYAYLLRSAASVTPAEYHWATRTGDPAALLIHTPEQLRATLVSQRVEPYPRGRRTFKRIGPKRIRVRDPYGSYPVRALLCHGSFWKAAVDSVLQEVDLVALDLSGLNRNNAGTLYEVQRVIDRIPIEHVVFLADRGSDGRFLTDELQAAWQRMAEGSPNAVAGQKVALVVRTDYIARTRSSQGQGQGQGQNQSSQVQVKLVSRRRQTRRVVHLAQDRIDGVVRE